MGLRGPKRDPEGLSSQDKSKAQSQTHPLPPSYIQNKPKCAGAHLLPETWAASCSWLRRSSPLLCSLLGVFSPGSTLLLAPNGPSARPSPSLLPSKSSSSKSIPRRPIPTWLCAPETDPASKLRGIFPGAGAAEICRLKPERPILSAFPSSPRYSFPPLSPKPSALSCWQSRKDLGKKFILNCQLLL